MKRLLVFLTVGACLAATASVAVAGSHALLYTLDGDSAQDRLGHAVCGVGDIDGDGYADIIAGAYYGNASRPGYARVYSGKDGKTIYTFKGDYNYDGFGVSVHGAGDVNADGDPDVIVGAYMSDPNGANSGLARVYSGEDGKVLHTFEGDSAGDQMGLTANGAGDVNDDGYDDLIVGAHLDDNAGADSGMARVYSGKDGTVLYTFNGNSSGDQFGVYVAGAGDVDRDGYDDVVVGAHYDDPNGSNSGSVEVYSGKTGKRIYRFEGNSADDRFGRCAEGAGDVNADGYPDIVVGAYLDDPRGSNSGTVHVYSGKDGKVLYTWYGDAADDRLGVHVSSAGDLNGDGYADIAAGAYCDDQNGSNCGSARFFSGKDGRVLYTFYGDSATDYFGRFVTTAGDVNGDGISDIVIGAYCDDHHGTNSGRVYVYASPVPTGTVTIDSGAVATNDTDVELSLTWKPASSGGSIADMRLRNAGETWGGWIPASATAPWKLPFGDGEKEVEAQFRDTEGAPSIVVSDSILLDQTRPSGAIVVAGGADWVRSRTVTVELSYTDHETGVVEMRLRNGADPWAAWRTVGSSLAWTLPSGDGWKTVGAQFRDLAGNVSDVAEDTVGVDATPPVVTLLVEEGAAFTPGREVTLTIRVDVGDGSGPMTMRFRPSTATFWYDWIPYEETYGWTVSPGDGEKGVVVQVRDQAGNESEVEDTIALDETGPEVESVLVNEGRPYVLPEEELTLLVKAKDGYGGSGVSDFKASFDGNTFTDWYPIAGETPVAVERPEAVGLLGATVFVRDRLGNETGPVVISLYLVEQGLPSLGSGAKFAGSIAGAFDVDVTELHLVAGDVLTVTPKTKKGSVVLALDLVGPGGVRCVLDRYPRFETKPMIKSYPVPETGLYHLVARRGSGADLGPYKLTAKVKQSKANKKGKGEFTGTEIPFGAVRGSTFKAALSGAGLTAAGVTLVGPEGEVPFVAKESNGKVAILPVVLGAGTGTYTIRFATARTVAARWSLKPPRIKGTVEE